MSQKKDKLGILTWVIFFLLGCGVFYHGMRNVILEIQAGAAQQVEAEVLETHIKTKEYSNPRRTTKSAVWEVSYNWNGKAYHEKIELHSDYQDRLAQYPKGSRMPVYIHSWFPGTPRLEFARSWGWLLFGLFEMGMALVLLLGIVVAVKDTFRPKFFDLEKLWPIPIGCTG